MSQGLMEKNFVPMWNGSKVLSKIVPSNLTQSGAEVIERQGPKLFKCLLALCPISQLFTTFSATEGSSTRATFRSNVFSSGHGPQHSFQVLCQFNEALQIYDFPLLSYFC